MLSLLIIDKIISKIVYNLILFSLKSNIYSILNKIF